MTRQESLFSKKTLHYYKQLKELEVELSKVTLPSLFAPEERINKSSPYEKLDAIFNKIEVFSENFGNYYYNDVNTNNISQKEFELLEIISTVAEKL